jgi:anaphase-promoting complex subunit 2
VHPLIISTIFWPGVESSSLHLGPKLERFVTAPRRQLTCRAATEYEAAFHHFKPDKHLRWVQSLGTIHLSVEFEDRVVEVNATPLQASLIELFEENDYWIAEDLAGRLGVSAEDVEGGLLFWSAENVLAQYETGWRLQERIEA